MRYNYRHFNHARLPSWCRGDSLLGEKIDLLVTVGKSLIEQSRDSGGSTASVAGDWAGDGLELVSGDVFRESDVPFWSSQATCHLFSHAFFWRYAVPSHWSRKNTAGSSLNVVGRHRGEGVMFDWAIGLVALTEEEREVSGCFDCAIGLVAVTVVATRSMRGAVLVLV